MTTLNRFQSLGLIDGKIGVAFTLPGRSRLPKAGFKVWLPNGVSIIEIMLRFAQQKHIFVGLSRAVFDGLGHGVRLMPYHIRAQEPAISLQSKCHPPGNSDQILVFESAQS